MNITWTLFSPQCYIIWNPELNSPCVPCPNGRKQKRQPVRWVYKRLLLGNKNQFSVSAQSLRWSVVFFTEANIHLYYTYICMCDTPISETLCSVRDGNVSAAVSSFSTFALVTRCATFFSCRLYVCAFVTRWFFLRLMQKLDASFNSPLFTMRKGKSWKVRYRSYHHSFLHRERKISILKSYTLNGCLIIWTFWSLKDNNVLANTQGANASSQYSDVNWSKINESKVK